MSENTPPSCQLLVQRPIGDLLSFTEVQQYFIAHYGGSVLSLSSSEEIQLEFPSPDVVDKIMIDVPHLIISEFGSEHEVICKRVLPEADLQRSPYGDNETLPASENLAQEYMSPIETEGTTPPNVSLTTRLLKTFPKQKQNKEIGLAQTAAAAPQLLQPIQGHRSAIRIQKAISPNFIITAEQVKVYDKLKQRKEAALREFHEVHAGGTSQEWQAFVEEFCSAMNSLSQEVGQSFKYSEHLELLRQAEIEITRFQQALPIYAQRRHICHLVESSRVSLILADTGSGKSTQIPQYLLSVGHFQRIVCTEPRKVAALSLAKRVSEELRTELGGAEVGHRVGDSGKAKYSVSRLQFTTDSFLLRECVQDPLLQRYNVVIVDEAHERSLHTDMLLAMLKSCLRERPDDFRVVITSATMDAALFREYFHDVVGPVPVLHVEGRKFHVSVNYSYQNDEEQSESAKPVRRIPRDYVQRVVEKVRQVCCEKPPGGILAFVTTPAETELCTNLLNAEETDAASDKWILQLHGRLQPDDQQKVFQPCPGGPGQRKVVFATNIAETSVTIPDVRYVVDCGLVKESSFDPTRNATTLEIGWISQSCAKQRQGRAGRTGDGECYRLYSKEQFDAMRPIFVAEMLRINLCQVVLYLLQRKVQDPLNFDFIEKPPKEAMKKAIDMLLTLGAVSRDHGFLQLTPLGTRIAQLSMVEPRLAKLILLALEEKDQHEDLLPAAMALASCVTVGNLFFRSDEDPNSAYMKKTQFGDHNGDIAALLNVFLQWLEQPSKLKREWCVKNYANGKCLRAVEDLLKEVRHALAPMLPFEHPCRNVEHFKQVLVVPPDLMQTLMRLFCQCYVENVAMFSGHSQVGYFVPGLDEYVRVGKSSQLRCHLENEAWPQWVVFEYVMHTSAAYMFNVVNVLQEDWVLGHIPQQWKNKCQTQQLQRILPEGGFGIPAKKCILREHYRKLESLVTEPIVIQYQTSNMFKRLELLVTPSCSSVIMERIRLIVEPIKEEMKQRFRELAIHADSATRVCLAVGGAVTDVLLANEFRTCFVSQVPVRSSSQEAVKLELERLTGLGTVTQTYANKHPANALTIDQWDSVGFSNKQAAQRAVDRLAQLQNAPFRLRPNTKGPARVNVNTAQSSFRIEFTWCRRPLQNVAYIQLTTASHAQEAAAKMKDISGGALESSVNKKKGDEIYVFQSSGPIEIGNEKFVEHIRLLLQPLGIPVDSGFVGRKKAYSTTPKLLESYRQQFMDHFKRLSPDVPLETCKLEFTRPKYDADCYQRGTLTMRNLHQAETMAHLLKADPLFIENEMVSFKCSAEVTILPNLVAILDEELQSLKTIAPKLFPETCLEIVTLQSKRVVARIQSPLPKITLYLRQRVQDLVNGEILQDFALATALRQSQGQPFLRTLQDIHGSPLDVYVNSSNGTITLHGSNQAVEHAKAQLKTFGDIVRQRQEQQIVISLRPPEYPSAVLRQLLRYCQHDLEKVELELEGCTLLKLDCQRPSITYQGSHEGRIQLEKLLVALSDGIPATSNVNYDSVDCVVCFSPLEENKSRWRCLDVCGHYYCTECLNMQFNSAMKNRDFPVVCAAENCGECWSITDIESVIRRVTGTEEQRGVMNWQPLVDASMNSFIRKSNEYRNCPTTNCVGIYQASNDMQQFSCDLCNQCVCTACNRPYHEDETCESYAQNVAMLRDGNTVDSVTRWLQQDTANRRNCPKCGVVIEKNGGCPHVACTKCGVHMCWMCMATFSTAPETYKHMESNVCRR